MTDVEFEDKVIAKWFSKKNDANKRGIEFNLSLLSIRNLMKAKRCFYTGVALGDIGIHQRTIDRIDGNKGYVKGNVVACSAYVNNIKATFERQPGMVAQIIVKLNKLKKEN